MPAKARFVVRGRDARYRWSLIAGDGRALLTSQAYSRRDAALRAVERAREAIAAAGVEA